MLIFLWFHILEDSAYHRSENSEHSIC